MASIKKTDLAEIFGGFDSVNKSSQQHVSIDLHEIAVGIANATNECKTADGDPEQNIIKLAKFVDEMDALLDGASVDEETFDIFVMKDVECEEQEPAAKEEDLSEQDKEPSEDGQEETTKDVENEGEVEWSHDMAPEKPPLSRLERMSKDERAQYEASIKVKKNARSHFDRERCLS